ncbi:uncharacterized protein MICPUCDRAFT_3251, partial [Micromonas pusilla CCMP1545]
PTSAFTNAFTNAKAGMEGVDREMVKRVVHDMSVNSAHFATESRKEAAVEAKILAMKKRAASIRPSALATIKAAVDDRVARMEASRDLTKTWVHVDMDSFFASVHILERPELRDVPMAVGGMSMISTANYAARKFGVRSAMPGFIAKKLCPQLVFVDSDFAKYKHYASLTREVFKEYDPQFDAGSLDEAYLEISAYCAGKSMTPADVAEALRREVREKTKLTCSAGVAPTRRLAKVCSDANKPDGQMVIEPTRDAVAALLSSLPVRKIGGVGKVLDRTLAAFGIATCGDLLRERALVVALFSEVQSDFLLGVAIGVGGEARPARPPGWAPQRKSLSQERTFAPTADARALAAKIAALAEEVAAGLARENLLTRTVTLKMKRADFEVAQRQTSLPRPTNDAQTISDAALRLFRGEKNTHGSLRLLG